MSSISQRLYNEVMMADDFTCVYCGKRTADATIDHFVPRSYGGPDVFHNLFACCPECNSRKSDYSAHEVGLAPHFGRFANLDAAKRPLLIPFERVLPRAKAYRIQHSGRTNRIPISAGERESRAADLARETTDSGAYRYSSNAICRLIGGSRQQVLRFVRAAREAA